jgi:hypothetical protein
MYIGIVLMCVDCVLASPRITQADPSWQTPPEGVLSHAWQPQASTPVVARCIHSTHGLARHRSKQLLYLLFIHVLVTSVATTTSTCSRSSSSPMAPCAALGPPHARLPLQWPGTRWHKASKPIDTIAGLATLDWNTGEVVMYTHQSGELIRLPRGTTQLVTLKVLEFLYVSARGAGWWAAMTTWAQSFIQCGTQPWRGPRMMQHHGNARVAPTTMGWAEPVARRGARWACGEEDKEHWILRPGANKRRGRGTTVKSGYSFRIIKVR